MAGRANDGNQRGGEEHLNDSDIAFVAVKDFGEGVRVVDAKAFAGADSQTAVVLVEGDEVERAARHGGCCVCRCRASEYDARCVVIAVVPGLATKEGET